VIVPIDLPSNEVLAIVPMPDSGLPWTLTYGDGSTWVTSWPGQGTSPGGLHRLDPASGSFVESFSLPPGRYGHEVVVAFDSVWSANFDADDIWRLGVSP
jgi:streptogramin lyase